MKPPNKPTYFLCLRKKWKEGGRRKSGIIIKLYLLICWLLQNIDTYFNWVPCLRIFTSLRCTSNSETACSEIATQQGRSAFCDCGSIQVATRAMSFACLLMRPSLPSTIANFPVCYSEMCSTSDPYLKQIWHFKTAEQFIAAMKNCSYV